MKFRHLFLSLLAGVALFAGCQDDELDLGLPEIKISQKELALDSNVGSTVLSVYSTRDWSISTNADWVAVNPPKGNAYKETQVTVTILENEGYNRNATVRFDIGYDSKTLTINQEGVLGEKSEGTGVVEDPYTVVGVLAYIQTLGTAESDKVVYVQGKINTIATPFASDFGNATFTISDEGSSDIFTCYRVYYLGNKKWTDNDKPIKEGDEVIVAGRVVNYNGKTMETVTGTGYIYMLNGEVGSAGGGDTGDTGETVYFNNFDKSVATQTYGSGSSWPYTDEFEGWKNETGSGIADVSYDIAGISIRSNSASNSNYSDYSGSGSNNLFFGADAHIWVKDIALEGSSFILSFGSEKYLYGASDNTFNHQEMLVYISADGEKWVPLNYAFPEGDKAGRWDKASSVFTLPEGTSTLHIYIKTTVGSAYRLDDLRIGTSEEAGETIDFTNGIDLGTGGGDNPGGDGSLGSGTLADPYTAAGAADAVKDLTWTSNTEYQSTDEVYVKGKISKIANNGTYTAGGTYGNASFYISEDGTEEGSQFYAFRVLYLGNKKFEEGQTDIVVGDEVIIYGKLMNYKGNTPETVAGAAYLYSLNGDTGEGGGNGAGTLANPYTVTGAFDAVKDLTWTSNTEYQSTDEVYVKGKISKIATNGTYTAGGTYGNASFYISEDGTEEGSQFYAFRVLYLGNKKFEEGQTDIVVGDEVIIYGKLMNYKGNTPETVAGAAYLYSLNGDTGESAGSGGNPGGDGSLGSGTLADPYTAAGAADAVKDLTWTSNTEYQSTDEVYVKGKISKIANNGTYTAGGTYGNASFYISEDGTEEGSQFYAFRVLYLGNKKFEEGQTDIVVGDEVIIYGKLMNYKGNTPETVAGAAFLYSLNGDTGESAGSGGNPGGDDPTGQGSEVTLSLNSSLTWAEESDNTYGAGLTTTTQNFVVGGYQYQSTTAINSSSTYVQADHIRVYKSSVLCITAPEGKKIKSIVMTPAGTSYLKNMTIVEGGGTFTKGSATLDWEGDASKVVLQASEAQIRMKSAVVVYE